MGVVDVSIFYLLRLEAVKQSMKWYLYTQLFYLV